MNRPTIITITALTGIALLLLLVIELIWGLSLTRGFQKIPVIEMYVIGAPEEELFLSIDSSPEQLPFITMR